MLRELAQGEPSVGPLAGSVDVPLATASKHLEVPKAAGLIRRELLGRTPICRPEAGPLAEADDCLCFHEHGWTALIDRREQRLHKGAAALKPSSTATSNVEPTLRTRQRLLPDRPMTVLAGACGHVHLGMLAASDRAARTASCGGGWLTPGAGCERHVPA